MIASIVTIALEVMARSEATSESGEAARRPWWVTAIGIVLIVLSSLVVLYMGMSGSHR